MRYRRLLPALCAPIAIGAVVTASVPGIITIRIRPGDTLSAIARDHHTTVAALIALNHLPGNGDLIYAGALLRVPGRVASPASGSSRARTYTVRSGDTVSEVAHRYHTSVAWLAARNSLGSRYTIYIGQRLRLPGQQPSAPDSFAGRTYPSAVVASAARHRDWLARHHVASRDRVRSLIVDAASRYRVDPALALAVAHQESGFQQGVVSPADAVGAMQVIPSTGDYVSRYVVHRRLNLLKAKDNVTAGVALLGQLTRAARTDQAVAGYYQGLGSVRKNGMYRDTKSYVRNVLTLREHYR